MDKNSQVKIGNEHFKTWLKRLDPVSRVEKMSAIAKTLASAGLRAQKIKASLAQLSQRCQVMLIKLSDGEIKLKTRKKPVKRLNNSDKTTNIANTTRVYTPTIEDKISSSEKHFNTYDKESVNCSKEISLEEINNKSSSPTKQLISKVSPNKTLNLENSLNKKLKKKFQELFGDDPDDLEEQLPLKKIQLNNSAGPEENSGGKNINNYVSTTVNVNIYNSTKKTLHGNDSSVNKKKMHKERAICDVKESSNNRVRIDVSLSSEEAGIGQGSVQQMQTFHFKKSKKADKSHKDRKRKKTKHSDSSRNKSNTSNFKSIKSNSPPLNTNISSPEDDPSLNELWSIFGMKSPTVRSETIRSESSKSIPLSSVSDTVALNNVSINGSCLQTTDKSIPGGGIGLEKNQHIEDTSVDTNTANDGLITQESESVCKIAQTFSLAEMSSTVSGLFNSVSSNSPDSNESTSGKLITNSDSSNEQNILSTTDKENSQVIETISILDDDDRDVQIDINKGQEDNCRREQIKVGTIRVKNLGLLMNPQLITDKSGTNDTVSDSPTNVQNEVVKEQTQTLPSTSQEPQKTVQTNVEERFFSVYKCYFNDFVEMKIPKLGELLHLAVADEIRRNERIKRAEQLSSHDLIKEEKQRAAKDFNDMMKIRGNEFSPLCEFILNTFDQSSKITLFIALLYRIMKHAEQIDPANKNLILDARNVISLMLTKYEFKHKEILDCLKCAKVEFEEQVELVGNLVEKCVNNGPVERNDPQHNKHMPSSTPPTVVVNYDVIQNSTTYNDLSSTQRVNNVSIRSSSIDNDLERNSDNALSNVINNRPLTSNKATHSNIETSLPSTNRVNVIKKVPLTSNTSSPVTQSDNMDTSSSTSINAVQLMNSVIKDSLMDNNLEKNGMTGLLSEFKRTPFTSSEVTQSGNINTSVVSSSSTSNVNSVQAMNSATGNYSINNDLERSNVNAIPSNATINIPLTSGQVTQGGWPKSQVNTPRPQLNTVSKYGMTPNNLNRGDITVLPSSTNEMPMRSFHVSQNNHINDSSMAKTRVGLVQLSSKAYQTSGTQNSIPQRQNITITVPRSAKRSTSNNYGASKANYLQISPPPMSIALVNMPQPTYLTTHSTGIPSGPRLQVPSYPIVLGNSNDIVTLTPTNVNTTYVNRSILNPQTSASLLPQRPVTIAPKPKPNILHSKTLENSQMKETPIVSEDQINKFNMNHPSHSVKLPMATTLAPKPKPNILRSKTIKNSQMKATPIVSQDQINKFNAMRNHPSHPVKLPTATTFNKGISFVPISVAEKLVGKRIQQIPVDSRRSSSDSSSFNVINNSNQISNGALNIHNTLGEYRAPVCCSGATSSNQTQVSFSGEIPRKLPSENVSAPNVVLTTAAITKTHPSTTLINTNQQHGNSTPVETTNTTSNQSDDSLSQRYVPSSSHCHPYVRRMPLSGKMRMLFENSTSN